MRSSSWPLGFHRESGSGTILGIAVLAVTLGIFSVAMALTSQSLEFSRLQALTDSIALASADALRGISTGYPCIVAKDMASPHGVVLERCRIVGFEVFIETELRGVRARARAGPGL